MHNLRHFYYQNKENILKGILIIAFILGIIYYLNYLVGEKNKTNLNNGAAQNNVSIYKDEENKTYISDKSAIYGDTIYEHEVEKINNTISKFLQYCRNGNTEEAYNMLSTDCKETLYSTLEKFQEKYIKLKFSNSSIFEIENWIDDTYKISISEDILATGKINNEKQTDYITIVKENSAEKLNINGYIGKKEINKQHTSNEIKIMAINKKVYMDYEEYELKIDNLSNKTIKLDSLEDTDTIYLKSSTNSNYNAYAHELYNEDLEIKSKHSNTINIKFAKTYSNNVQIEKIVFDNVILNYPKYKTEENKKEFKEICQFILDL